MNNYGLIIGITTRHGLYVRIPVGKQFINWSIYTFWKITLESNPKQYPIVFTRRDIANATRKWD